MGEKKRFSQSLKDFAAAVEQRDLVLEVTEAFDLAVAECQGDGTKLNLSKVVTATGEIGSTLVTAVADERTLRSEKWTRLYLVQAFRECVPFLATGK